MSQHVTLTATCTAGRSTPQMLRRPQPRVPVTAAGDDKALPSYGGPPALLQESTARKRQGILQDKNRGMVLSGIQASKNQQQNQLLHEKRPRKSQGVEMHCFRLY